MTETQNDMSHAEPEADICGLCGLPGADKYPHPIRWPGEAIPDKTFVHAECEEEECGRAHAELLRREGEFGVNRFLRSI
jgi:hypothetical protein